MTDYEDHWPGDGDVDAFVALTKDAVGAFKDGEASPAPKTIRAELSRLRSAIANLSPEAREEIGDRELKQWQSPRPEGTWFDDVYLRQATHIRDGDSALAVLEKSVAEDFQTKGDHDAAQRESLIARAALAFSIHGGGIEARYNSPFVVYVQHLFLDVGFGQADCPKAVWRFLVKNGGVLD
jgi:hypothetical protein